MRNPIMTNLYFNKLTCNNFSAFFQKYGTFLSNLHIFHEYSVGSFAFGKATPQTCHHQYQRSHHRPLHFCHSCRKTCSSPSSRTFSSSRIPQDLRIFGQPEQEQECSRYFEKLRARFERFSSSLGIWQHWLVLVDELRSGELELRGKVSWKIIKNWNWYPPFFNHVEFFFCGQWENSIFVCQQNARLFFLIKLSYRKKVLPQHKKKSLSNSHASNCVVVKISMQKKRVLVWRKTWYVFFKTKYMCKSEMILMQLSRMGFVGTWW